MDFSRWLTSWMQRHPVKEPSRMGSDYTREVVSKLARQAQPARAGRPWLLFFPSPAYALVSAAAVAVIVMALVRPSTQVAIQTQTHRGAVLAESNSTADETWVQQTMQLLDQLEETDSSAAGAKETTPQTDEQWLKELETLDEADLAASS